MRKNAICNKISSRYKKKSCKKLTNRFIALKKRYTIVLNSNCFEVYLFRRTTQPGKELKRQFVGEKSESKPGEKGGSRRGRRSDLIEQEFKRKTHYHPTEKQTGNKGIGRYIYKHKHYITFSLKFVSHSSCQAWAAGSMPPLCSWHHIHMLNLRSLTKIWAQDLYINQELAHKSPHNSKKKVALNRKKSGIWPSVWVDPPVDGRGEGGWGVKNVILNWIINEVSTLNRPLTHVIQ